MTLRPPPPLGTPADVEALIRARTAAIEARNHADADRDAAHEELVTMRTDRDHWRDAASGRAKRLDEVRDERDQARRDNHALRDSLDSADKVAAALREELDLMRTARDNWRRAHEAGVGMIARVAAERDDLRTELEAVRKAVGDDIGAVVADLDNLAATRGELEALRKAHGDATARLGAVYALTDPDDDTFLVLVKGIVYYTAAVNRVKHLIRATIDRPPTDGTRKDTDMPTIDLGTTGGPNLDRVPWESGSTHTATWTAITTADDDEDTETDPDAVTLREYITLEIDRAIATIHDHHVHITLTAPPVTGQGWTFNTTDAGLGSVTVTDPPDRPAGDHTTAKDTNQ